VHVVSLCRSGSLKKVARELARHKLDLVDVQDVGWDKENTVRAGDYISSVQRKLKSSTGNRFVIQNRIISIVKRAEFVSDRMSYEVLRGRRCNINVLNVHETSEEKSVDSKGSLYEKLRTDFNHFPKYHKKVLLGDLMQNWEERIFSNRQMRMRVYITIVMITVLE
jgi:hypothetical protein